MCHDQLRDMLGKMIRNKNRPLCENPSAGEYLLLDYTLGNLSPKQKKIFAAHLENCQSCRQDYLPRCTEPELGQYAVDFAIDINDIPDALESKQLIRHIVFCPACKTEIKNNLDYIQFMKSRKD